MSSAIERARRAARASMPASPAGGVALCALISALAYVRLQTKPSGHDTIDYLEAGAEILDRGGLITHWSFSEMRTYAYPFFVSRAHWVADALGLDTAGVVFLAQLVLHVAACIVLYRVLRPRSTRAAGVAAGLLLVNPVLVVYIPEVLTESLTVSLVILVVAAIAAAEAGLSRAVVLWPLAGALAGCAFVVRPANLVIAIALSGAFASYALGRGRASGSRNGSSSASGSRPRRALALAGAGGAAAFVLVLLPQLYLNVSIHDTASVLPVRDLGQLQLKAGARYLKYVTLMESDSPKGFYTNPFLEGSTAATPGEFYLGEPVAGLATLGVSAFGSITPDYLFPYVYEPRPAYRLPLLLGSHALSAAGLLALGLVLWRAAPWQRSRTPLGPLSAFLALAVAANLALNALTAPEVRFGFVSVICFSVAAGHLPQLLRGQSLSLLIARLVWCALYVGLATWLSYWILQQAVFL